MEEIDRYIASLGSVARRVAPGEWGLSLEADGWPLEVGLRLAHGVLLAQAMVLPAGALDHRSLLRANRALELVWFSLTESEEVWARGAIPHAGAREREVDRLLALLVRAAEWARVQAAARARSR